MDSIARSQILNLGAVPRHFAAADKMSSRLVFGVASLPLGVPVELEVIFEVSE